MPNVPDRMRLFAGGRKRGKDHASGGSQFKDAAVRPGETTDVGDIQLKD